MRFTGHSEIEIAHETDFFVKVTVVQRREESLSQAERERHEVGHSELDLQRAAQAARGFAHAKFPTSLDPGEVVMEDGASQEGNSGGVRDFAIQQRSQTVPAGNAVEKIIGTDILAGYLPAIPLRKLFDGALPKYFVLARVDAAQRIFIQRVGIGAFQHQPAAGAFPFAVLLLQVPRLQLRTTPPEIPGRDATQRGESRHAETRKNLWRDLVKTPCPTSERTGGCVIQLAIVPEQLRFSGSDLGHHIARH